MFKLDKEILKLLIFVVRIYVLKFNSEDTLTMFLFLPEFSFTIRRTGETMFSIPLNQFHSLHRYFDFTWAITADSSPNGVGSSQCRNGYFWFPSASG